MDRRTSLADFLWPRLLLTGMAAVLWVCAAASPAAGAPAPAPPPAASPGSVQVTGVSVQAAGAGGLVILVNADGPIPSFESFALPEPPRLVVDIPNAVHAISQPIAAHPPLVTAIRSSQYREQPVKIVRLVFDLKSLEPYQVESVGNQLKVALGTAAPAPTAGQAGGTGGPVAAPVPATPAAAATTGPSIGRVSRVDLQSVRGRQRIVIRTSGRVTVKVTESAEPQALLIDVMGAAIDPAAARSLDLGQAASPVSRLQATQYQTAPEPVVRVQADLRGPTRYDVRQGASAITVDLLTPASRVAAAGPTAPSPAAPAPAAAGTSAPAAPPAAAPAAPGAGRLSLDFKDADINNLLRIIAEVSGMNVVAGSDVSGKVTIRLVNVEWQQALEVILRINNMGYEMDGNIIRVAPLAKLEAERKAREDARVAAARAREAEQVVKVKEELSIPLETEVISVNYAKAADVVKNLNPLKTPGRADASIAVDDRTNKLIIKDTRAALDKMVDLLKQLDQPTPQVLIEARLVEATRTFAQSLGIEWGFVNNSTVQVSKGGLTPLSIFGSVVGTALTIPDTSTVPVPLQVSFPAAGTSPAGIGFSLGSAGSSRLLSARLSAAESESRIKTLSAPKVATLDNQEAEIRQGSQVPYTTVDSSGRTVVAFQDAFIRLKVTPHITNDRRVSMKVEAERSFPGDRIDFAGGFAFALQQRKATTNVLVTNGGTIVIGGLLQTDDSVTEAGIPWLMRVPILGILFKNHSVGPDTRTELLIFLTPTILEEPRLS